MCICLYVYVHIDIDKYIGIGIDIDVGIDVDRDADIGRDIDRSEGATFASVCLSIHSQSYLGMCTCAYVTTHIRTYVYIRIYI